MATMGTHRKSNLAKESSEDSIDVVNSKLEKFFSLFLDDYHNGKGNHDIRIRKVLFTSEEADILNVNKYTERTYFSQNEGKYICFFVSLPHTANIFNPFKSEECNIQCSSGVRCYFHKIEIREIARHTYIISSVVDTSKMNIETGKRITIKISLNKDGNIFSGQYEMTMVNAERVHIPITKVLEITANDNNGVKKSYISLDFDCVTNVAIEWIGKIKDCDELFKGKQVEMVATIYDGNTGTAIHTFSFNPEKNCDGIWQLTMNFISSYTLNNGRYMLRFYYLGKEFLAGEFRIGEAIEGRINYFMPSPYAKVISPVGQAMKQIDKLVGLAEVKYEIRRNLNYVRIFKARRERNLPCPERLQHIIMTGSPGTGKTTVARLIAGTMHEIGLLSKGHIVECNRQLLTDVWIGGTEKKTQGLIEQSKGGCLFIDEAYSLYSEEGDMRDCGRKVIDTLMPVLSDPNSDLLVILAGYEKEMKKLLGMNPGLASRFPVRLNFPDYNVEEMMEIFMHFCRSNCFTLTTDALNLLRGMMTETVKKKDNGNGRFVYNLLNNFIIPNMGERLSTSIDCGKVTPELLSTICPEDIPNAEEVFHRLGLDRTSTRSPIGFHSSLA